MRLELLYNPRLLCERLAIESVRKRRLRKLKGTPGESLSLGHVDSLELLELARPLGIGVIYDVGANIGTWALLAKSVIADSRVEAFEPLPKHYPRFGRMLSDVQGVTLHKVALGSKRTSANLRVTDFSDASSILPITDVSRSHFGIEEVERVAVEVWSLDEYRAAHHLLAPDLIKLDVQGYELEVLKGASGCLKSVKAVVAEVSFIEYYHGQCLFHNLVAFLAEAGLHVAAFGVNTPPATVLNQTDVLFLRRGD